MHLPKVKQAKKMIRIPRDQPVLPLTCLYFLPQATAVYHRRPYHAAEL